MAVLGITPLCLLANRTHCKMEQRILEHTLHLLGAQYCPHGDSHRTLLLCGNNAVNHCLCDKASKYLESSQLPIMALLWVNKFRFSGVGTVCVCVWECERERSTSCSRHEWQNVYWKDSLVFLSQDQVHTSLVPIVWENVFIPILYTGGRL